MTENIPLYGSQNATYSQMGTCHDFFSKSILPLGNAYKYDQLNRLIGAISFTNLSSNTWGTGGTGIYNNNFTYDANGNIKTQVRKNNSGTTIDDLKYAYQQNSANKTVRNRLYHVDDGANPSTFTDDIDDMGSFVGNGTINTANNYSYDAEGRLIKDSQEQIASIEWRVDGKVKAINRTNGSSRKNLKFDYDAMGHRIAKHVLSSSNALESTTYYILDAQGNTMATYEREIISASVYYSQKERYIYGSARLGVMTEQIALYGSQNATYSQATWNDTIGKRTYELTNHLGNVLSVISDKVIPHSNGSGGVDYFLADIRQSTDYSPFGVQLDNRNMLLTGITKDYRHGYQGSEEDDQVKGDGNSYTTFFRQLDPRLGRWLSIDPKASASESPYASMGNNPILFNDPLGDTIKFEGKGQKLIKFKLNIMRKFARKEIRDMIKDLDKDDKIILLTSEGSSKYGANTASTGVLKGDVDITMSFKIGAYRNIAYVAEGGGWSRANLKQALAHELSHAFDVISGQVSYIQKTKKWSNGHIEYFDEDESEAMRRQNLVDRFGKKRATDTYKTTSSFHSIRDAKKFTRIMRIYENNPCRAEKIIKSNYDPDKIMRPENQAKRIINIYYE